MFSQIFLVLTLVVGAIGLPIVAGQDAKVQRPTTYWPDDVKWNRKIDTPKEFFGFEIGQRHLDHAKLVTYLQRISSQSNRISVQQYGTTYGGRPLLLLTISSPENLSKIETIRKSHHQLADPKLSVSVDIANLPAVINMGYGVHGDEASATNCSALVAHYLAAAQGEEVETWLKNCVVLLDPSLNPDGFNRFANWVNGYRGRVPNADPQHREHNQAWPSGRVNYYWFDLNRDWLPLEHPESRSRMRWYHAWKPNVVLDFHEMGTNTTYFFQPGVPNRTNPLTPQKNIELTKKFAEFHGRALDQRGSLYFTQERFDDFYMGKGSTYPDLHGAVGILFEQASARGHVQRNQDGRLTFHQAIANHFTTSLSSLRATSQLSEELLEYKRGFYYDSVESSRREERSAYVFSCEGNRTRLQDFANVLLAHDIECYWAKDEMEVDGVRLAKDGSLVVPLEQPEYRFLKSLLMRRKNFKENIFYDVSSWTLPLAYGLQQQTVTSKLDFAKLRLAKQNERQRSGAGLPNEAIAYAVDWRDDKCCRLLNRMLRKEINVKVATRPFSVVTDARGNRKSLGRGTLLVQLGIQKQKARMIGELLTDYARRSGGVTPILSGLSLSGPDIGSDQFRKIAAPKIAMPVGPGISQYEAGEVWHSLDQRHGIPLTMLDSKRFGKYDLREYQTFVFPSGKYHEWDQETWEAVAAEIKNGGTAIAIGSSCDSVRKFLTGKQEVSGDQQVEGAVTTQLEFDSRAKTKALQLISGAIFKTKIDLTHPLFYGFSSNRMPVFRNHASFLKPSENPYLSPAIYDKNAPHMAGYCSQENVEKFKTSASVVVIPMGKGRLIQISDNPNFRAFWHGTNRMFLNAIFFGEFSSF